MINAARAARISRKTGHDAHDSECVFWKGDFAGVNLRARCPICSPEPERRSNRVVRAIRVLLGRD